MVSAFYQTNHTSFGPIAAFMGGVVSQEIVKAITQKFTPINQFFYYDLSELYNGHDINREKEWDQLDSNGDRYVSI